jgi:hypothetical protein
VRRIDMAIKRVVDQGNGVFPEYWRIVDLHLYFKSDSALAEVEGYLNEGARKEGLGPVVPNVHIRISSGVNNAVASARGDVRSAIYPLLDFKGSVLEGGDKI